MHPTETIDRDSLRDDIPEFRPGDTVKVHVRVVEGNRERVQVFQGAVMRRQGGGVQETFTVRKVSFGVGVERTFPVHSPTIAKIEVTTSATSAGPSSTTCATVTGRPPKSRSAGSLGARPLRRWSRTMSTSATTTSKRSIRWTRSTTWTPSTRPQPTKPRPTTPSRRTQTSRAVAA